MARWLAGLLLAAAALAAAANERVVVDRIVAVVNKDVITLSELDDRVARAERDLERRKIQPPERTALEHQVLERLVLERAQLQLASETGMRVDELQLDRAVQRVAENNNMTLVQLRGALEQDGVAFDTFRDELRQQILLSRLREREVDDKIQVSETEIDQYLEDHKAGAERRGRIRGRAHPGARAGAGEPRADRAGARARRERARGGGRRRGFRAARREPVRRRRTRCRAARSAGAPRDRLPELFDAALKRMQPGDVSPVLRSPAGFHIVKLLARRGAAAPRRR